LAHFAVTVILPKGTREEDVCDDLVLHSIIWNLIEAYDENKDDPIDGGRYDWWEIGGSWDGEFGDEGQPTNVCKVREIKAKEPMYALVTPDGGWHARGVLDTFCAAENEKDSLRWAAEYSEILSAFPDHYAVLIDAHV